MTVSTSIFQPSHLRSAEAEAWHPDNLAKSGAQPRDDEIEARRIAAELARLHRDGAIASKSAHDPDAVFYARLLRDFGATYIGSRRSQSDRVPSAMTSNASERISVATPTSRSPMMMKIPSEGVAAVENIRPRRPELKGHRS